MAQESDPVGDRIADTSGGDASASPETAEIRSQIEATRASISETLDALQDRLSPSHLVGAAREKVADATVGRAKRLTDRSVKALREHRDDAAVVLDAVRDYPIAAAATGLAAATAVVTGVKYFRAQSRNRSYTARSTRLPYRAAATSRYGDRWLLVAGACAAFVCWSAWRAEPPLTDVSTIDDLDMPDLSDA